MGGVIRQTNKQIENYSKMLKGFFIASNLGSAACRS